MKFPQYFDPGKPTVGEMKSKIGNRFIDLTGYDDLSHADVADGILEASRREGYGLVIPEGPEFRFWDREKVVSVKRHKIKLDSPLRFMKFGPDINLTERSTPVKMFKEDKLTPRKLFREVLGSSDNREKLLNGSHRGIGWWDPKSKTHRLLPFDVPAEGEKFRDFYRDEMRFGYQRSDAYVKVPSITREKIREYIITTTVLPVTKEDDNFHYEWSMTNVPCQCEDRFFRGTAGKVKKDEEIEDLYKYAIPEYQFCRHGWGSLIETQERGETITDAKPFLVKFPTTTGILGPWYTLSANTIIKSGNIERRPLKTEVRIQLGRVIGYAGPDAMFDLTE